MKVEKVCFIDDNGNPNYYMVRPEGAQEIIEHEARGEGDKWYYDIFLKDGRKIRLFKVDSVEYFNENKNPESR
jgi:hypothetical protein